MHNAQTACMEPSWILRTDIWTKHRCLHRCWCLAAARPQNLATKILDLGAPTPMPQNWARKILDGPAQFAKLWLAATGILAACDWHLELTIQHTKPKPGISNPGSSTSTDSSSRTFKTFGAKLLVPNFNSQNFWGYEGNHNSDNARHKLSLDFGTPPALILPHK